MDDVVKTDDKAAPNAEAGRRGMRESAFFVASFTVLGGLLGGLLTTWVSGMIQDRNKRNELAIMSYKDFVADRSAATKRVFEAVGAYLSATEDLIRVRSPLFEHGGQGATKTAGLIVLHYNDVDREWRNSRYSLRFLLDQYHSSRDVGSAWRQLDQAMSAFSKCAHEVYETKGGISSESPCDEQRRLVESAYEGLSTALDKSRAERYDAAQKGR